jgi:hypothetical protein
MKARRSVLRSFRLALGLLGVSVTAVGLRDARANNWPPPPGADMTNPANWPNDPGYAGTWNFFSWLPKQDPGTPAYSMPDQLLGASGMSVDRAWTYSIGDPTVKIAILDSGIEWDSPDIINKAFLNTGELSKPTQMPQNAQGMPCGGAGALKGYDCDGDGVFTMNDYASDPRMTPIVKGDPCLSGGNPATPGADRMKGDVNHNCYLDPGDLIEMFSDGVDDDGNGYTDDISGWDFYKNDNDPYDDTRYGHGTGEAHDSSAQGNNMIEDIGSCPNCRFMMLRAGNSFIADVNDFAKGVVYATDNGVSVIQEALGTINQNAFSRAAIDYAYSKNVTVIASMADENSRHHNMPGTANHTLPVHAIVYNGGSSTSSTSFLAFNTCTNFGGQTGLAISATACSSQATGLDSGYTGLLYSYAKKTGIALTAEEVMQLEKMTSDVINVPDSRSTDPNVRDAYYESLPGFSQRFGYGRPNGQKAMEAIKSGLIPPEVEILTPAWFDTLYEGRVSGPVPIIGRVVAARATSYDFTVEWAPGVEQPDDSAFQPLGSPLRNVPGKTTTGGPSSPLATIDPSQIDTSHPADPDSPHHENDRTITIRVQATAHYPQGDAKGEARRTLAIVNSMNGLDPDLLPGFPIKLNGSGEAPPKLADIDGDGIRDIVAASSDGAMNVYSLASGMPVQVPGFPVYTNPIDGMDPKPTVASLPSYLGSRAYKNGASGGVDPKLAHESVVGGPAIADMNGDGKPDIAFSTWGGTIHIVDAHGKPLPGWPIRLPLVPSCPQDPNLPKPTGPCMDLQHDWARGVASAPVLIDMDNDGKPELIQSAFDGNIYIFHGDGTPLAGWPVAIHSKHAARYERILTTPAVADYNGDGIPDLLTGSNERVGGGGDAGPVFLVDGRGNKTPGSPYMTNWPVNMTSLYLFPIVAEGIDASPVAFDMNMDGVPDALLQGNGSPPIVLPTDPGVQASFGDPPNVLPERPGDTMTPRGFDPTSEFGANSTANRPDTMFPVLSQPSVGDLDQDGIPDVVMSGGSLSLATNLAGGSSTRPFQHLLGMWSGATGHMFPGSPVVLEDYTFFMSMAIADVGGPGGQPDGYPEVILGTGAYFVHAVDACGREPPGWPKFTNGWLTATPAVGDIDGDATHTLEVVTQTRDGWLYAWHTTGTQDGVIEWESFHHDNANTGNYNRKLDQGGPRAPTVTPLDCSVSAATPSPGPTYKASGSGCAASGRGDAPARLTWGFGALVVFGLLRRRRTGAT